MATMLSRLGRVLMLLLLMALSPPVQAADGPLASRATFGEGREVMIVVVHGDLSIGLAANYHYDFAIRAMQTFPQSTVVGLLRPGYRDGQGRVSPGSALGRKDNYTREAVDMIARTIQALKDKGGFPRVIAVGHSGGAAIIANALALHPGVIDSAVLVSCPCDIERWRRFVLSKSSGSRDGAVSDWHRSLSPQRLVADVDRHARVVAITSGTDNLTPPSLAERYVRSLKDHGVTARFIKSPDPGHFLWNLTPSVLAALGQEVAALGPSE